MSSFGARLFVFPRTVSFGNWPFPVFIAFLAAFFGAIALAPALIGVVFYATEPFGSRVVEAIHDEGIVWRRGFVPWNEVTDIERKDVRCCSKIIPGA